MKGKMAVETLPATPGRPVWMKDRLVAFPGPIKVNGRVVSEKDLRADGNSTDDLPQVSDIRDDRRVRGYRYKRSMSSSWGLGDGMTGRMTGVAIIGLLLLSVAFPVAMFKLHKMQNERQQQAGDTLPGPEQEGGEMQYDQQQGPAALVGRDGPQSSVQKGQLPVTPNLHETFISLKHTGGHGLLFSVRGNGWDYVRESFLAAVDHIADISPSVFENAYSQNEETLRLTLAMDLACLENEAIETKLAIEDARAGHGGGYTEEMAVLLQQNMQARRTQAEAAGLWEEAVVNDRLGSDPELKDGLMRLLLAVRSRAASSEYLTAVSADVILYSESSPRSHAEENRAQEGVAYLIKAGQLAATNSSVKFFVAPWLSIIFSSF